MQSKNLVYIATLILSLQFISSCKKEIDVNSLRAAFYFDLVTFFRNIPLIEGTVSIDSLYSVVQTTPDKIYAYVEKNLTEAIPDLPVTVPVASEGGRLTQGGAKAILGKV